MFDSCNKMTTNYYGKLKNKGTLGTGNKYMVGQPLIFYILAMLKYAAEQLASK